MVHSSNVTVSVAPKDYALVIGIDDYSRANELGGVNAVGSLGGASNDAQAFCEWLKATFSDGTLGEDQIVARSREVTLSDVFTLIDTVVRRVGAEGRRLYVFLAGHGAAKNPTKSLLLTSDYASSVPLSWEIVDDVTTMGRLFREVILFVDCCQSDAPRVRPYQFPWLDQVDPTRAMASYFHCFSCAVTETVEEVMTSSGMRGAFSVRLMDILEGRDESAIDIRGHVTAHAVMKSLTKPSVMPQPRFDPGPDKEPLLRSIVLARFDPRPRPLEIRMTDPELGFTLFNWRLQPLELERVSMTHDVVIVERENAESIIVAKGQVDRVAGSYFKEVLPDDPEVTI
jgi:hypothetical protein